MSKPKALFIYGPTASGKTGLAIKIAQKYDGIVINADSRQLFKYMPILTAVPTQEEQTQAPHILYEVLDPATSFSAGEYLSLSHKVAADISGITPHDYPEKESVEEAYAAAGDLSIHRGKLPIFVGGSGLYMEAILEGLAAVPPVPTDVLDNYKQRLKEEGVALLYQELQQKDPAWAERIEAADSQRTLRGLSVLEATGKKMSDWIKEP